MASYQSLSSHSAFASPEFKKPSLSLFPPTSSFQSRATVHSSQLFQKLCQLDDNFVQRLDRTEILGGYNDENELIGHSGCVNALSWSQNGDLLASGSDDRNVVLWKLGTDEVHPAATKQTQRGRHFAFRSFDPFSSASLDDDRGRSTDNHTSDDDEEDEDEEEEMEDISMAEAGAHVSQGRSGHRTSIVQEWPQRSFPPLRMGMLGKIQTGHRANIFSVKWAPYSSDRRIFTCAGDRQVRVFDINYAPGMGSGSGQIHRMADGKEYTLWNESSNACIRVFRCHKDRAKRISTENSPDIFLTCSEDGDVRQMDLRTPHRCGSGRDYGEGCPAPLAHFPMGLYSLSVSKAEPWLFAVAGMSKYAYLQDRRMIPRLLKREWGISLSTANPEEAERQALTMCVRRFGQPPGGFDRPDVENDRRTVRSPFRERRGSSWPAEDQDGADDDAEEDEGDIHITACKINESTGREIIVSYSNGGIYRFGIYDEPGVLHHKPEFFSLPRPSVSRTRYDQETLDTISAAKRRCIRVLFPNLGRSKRDLESVQEGSSKEDDRSKFEAVTSDLNTLETILSSDRDDDGDMTEEYSGVEVCRVLARIAFAGVSTDGGSADHEAGGTKHVASALSKQIRRTIEFLHTNFNCFKTERTMVPLLEELDQALGWEARVEFEKIKDRLWHKAADLLSEIWIDEEDEFCETQDQAEEGEKGLSQGGEDTSREEGGVGEEGEPSRSGLSSREGPSKKRARVSAEVAESKPGQDASLSESNIRATSPQPSSTSLDEDGDDDTDGAGTDSSDEDEDEDEDESDETDSLEADSDYMQEAMDHGFDMDMSTGIQDTLQRAPIVYPRSVYEGHANIETVKDVNFAGRDDRYVISGSDDGNWFLWDTESSELKGLWKGDSSVVNVLQPHPSLPVLAISGIDDTVKLFGPVTLSAWPPGAAGRGRQGKTATSARGGMRSARSSAADRVRSGGEEEANEGDEAKRPVKVADLLDRRNGIIGANNMRMHAHQRRPGLTTRTLLSMLQQHVFQSATEDRQRAGAAGRGGANSEYGLVLRRLEDGGFALGARTRDPDEGGGRGGQGDEDEECIIM